MSQPTTLAQRIDAEFAAAEQKIKQLQKQQVEQYQQRQQRQEKLEHVLEAHRDVSRPRLETLASRFADRVKVTPRIVPGRRQASFEIDSELAHVVLKFSVTADSEVENVAFTYSHYLKDHMVEDPLARVRFPKFAAGARLEASGKTVYFTREATRQEYEQKQKAPV